MFRIPLEKDDLLHALRMKGGRDRLEKRLGREMAGAESLMVG